MTVHDATRHNRLDSSGAEPCVDVCGRNRVPWTQCVQDPMDKSSGLTISSSGRLVLVTIGPRVTTPRCAFVCSAVDVIRGNEAHLVHQYRNKVMMDFHDRVVFQTQEMMFVMRYPSRSHETAVRNFIAEYIAVYDCRVPS